MIRVESLSRLLSYVLGHRPDEFGLVPDPDGFVPFKQLLWALHEEPGWGYVRQGDIHEVLLRKGRSHFEVQDERIRAVDRRWETLKEASSKEPPKILYVAVRRRAHAHVVEKGLTSEKSIPLAADRALALRIGKRRDPRPVMLEILTAPAREEGVSFTPFGRLYVTHEVPARFLFGPPVEEEKPGVRKDERPEEKRVGPRLASSSPGTFALDARKDPDLYRRAAGRKAKGWKEDARKFRKRRER